MTEQKKPTLAEMIARAKANKPIVAQPAQQAFKLGVGPQMGAVVSPTKRPEPTHTHKPSSLADLLKGSGITKKEVAKANTDQLRADETLKIASKLREAREGTQPQEIERVHVPTVDLLPETQSLDDKVLEDDPSQKAAIEGIVSQQFSCLIGAAGTGKSTVTMQIVKAIENKLPLFEAHKAGIDNRDMPDEEKIAKPEYRRAICFCAFTGRAVEQLKQKLPPEYHANAGTIHATLGFHPEYYDEDDPENPGETKQKMRFVPEFTESNKLPYKVYFIDEAGMLGTQLWNQLRAAMTDDAQVVMIGDINQLPPVHDKPILAFAMSKWPVFELTKVHRNAGPIVEQAHKILKGSMPTKITNTFDMVLIPDGSFQAFQKVIGQIKVLHKHGSFNEKTDAIIVAVNKNQLGQTTINEALIPYFNPPREEGGIVINRRIAIQTGNGVAGFAVGDKIMALQNNRDLGITNGMIGWVTEINLNGKFKGNAIDPSGMDMLDAEIDLGDNFLDTVAKHAGAIHDDDKERQGSHILTAKFHNGTKWVEIKIKSSKEYRTITPAYAFTCHKTQGGEYPVTVILCHASNPALLSREWLYTAVTRAKTRVILLYNNRGLALAMQRQHIKGKTLQEKIKSFMQWVVENGDGVYTMGNLEVQLPDPVQTKLFGDK